MPVSDDFKASAGSTSNFSDIKDGLYQLEVLDITSKKEATYETYLLPEDKKVMVEKLQVEFAILTDKKDVDDNSTRGRRIWKSVTPVLSAASSSKSPSNLYLLTKAIMGTPPEVLDAEAINSLIGTQLQAVVKNKVSKAGRHSLDISFDSLIEAEELMESTRTEEVSDDLPF